MMMNDLKYRPRITTTTTSIPFIFPISCFNVCLNDVNNDDDDDDDNDVENKDTDTLSQLG